MIAIRIDVSQVEDYRSQGWTVVFCFNYLTKGNPRGSFIAYLEKEKISEETS